MIAHGFFGKLPSLGDFVGRGWANTANDALDKLLQAALERVLAATDIGKQVIARAPDVILSIRPGIVAKEGFVLAVVPSEDRVGRVFPLCAGVQWDAVPPGWQMAWPSAHYGQALAVCLRRNIENEASPDTLLREIEALGELGAYGPTFASVVGDETVPRLPAEVRTLHVEGPLSNMSLANQSLCVALSESSDLLALCLDDAGEARHFAICRRLASPGTLAALFDGLWDANGWMSLPVTEPTTSKGSSEVDDDATQPLLLRIDRAEPPPDSSNTS